jgi:dolichol kinase
MDLETKRQLIHMSGYSVALYIPWAFTSFGFLPLLASLVLAVLLLYSVSLAYKNNLRVPVVAWLIDISERRNMIRKSPARGAIMFLVGASLAVILFDPYVAAAAVAVLALGDAFSTLVGRRYGSAKIPYNPDKSVQGTLAGLAAAFIGASAFIPPHYALVAAAAGMAGESLPLRVDDNVVIPLASGSALSLAGLI